MMSKFGELISTERPVLIDFFKNWEEDTSDSNQLLRAVAAALGDKAKVVRIDVDKNEILIKALRIKGNPTYIIYKEGEMKWRQAGEQDANTLISLVEQYL